MLGRGPGRGKGRSSTGTAAAIGSKPFPPMLPSSNERSTAELKPTSRSLGADQSNMK
jgi:hypothetical protein